jgi:hypothetical protein
LLPIFVGAKDLEFNQTRNLILGLIDSSPKSCENSETNDMGGPIGVGDRTLALKAFEARDETGA